MVTALLWVMGGLGSLASTVVAIWITLSLARAASIDDPGFGNTPVWLWTFTLVLTLGVPFALATWKHQGDARRISLTMAWLPMLWNVGGLLVAVQVVPDIVASALRTQGAWVATNQMGETHSAGRVLSALGHQTADFVKPVEELSDGQGAATPAPLRLDMAKDVDLSKAILVPFTEEGTAIVMQATLQGNNGEEIELPYLFDTGASFTTINTETATKLGIVVPSDAPTLTFNTASGPRISKMVYLPGLKLGRVEIRGLLVSVCDRCSNERSVGLLGHNVMREFFAQIDYKSQRMLVIPRTVTEVPNRAYDIGHIVELKLDGPPEVWLGRVHWVVTVRNRSDVPITDVTPEVRFADGPNLRGKLISRIEPGQVGRSLVEGRTNIDGKDESTGHYTLAIAEAFW